MRVFRLKNNLEIVSASCSEILKEIQVNDSQESKFIATLNIDQYLNILQSEEVATIYSKHHLNLVDGQALSWLFRLNFRNFREFTRVAGVDLTRAILCQKQFKVAILGSEVNEISETIKRLDWRATLVYHNVMPSDLINESFFIAEIRKRIEFEKPDVVFLCLGSPKQEYYMSRNLIDIPSFFIGIGGTFAILSGKLKRAPRLVQVIGFEWLFRWIQEPKRLSSRYLKNLQFTPRLFSLALFQKL